MLTAVTAVTPMTMSSSVRAGDTATTGGGAELRGRGATGGFSRAASTSTAVRWAERRDTTTGLASFSLSTSVDVAEFSLSEVFGSLRRGATAGGLFFAEPCSSTTRPTGCLGGDDDDDVAATLRFVSGCALSACGVGSLRGSQALKPTTAVISETFGGIGATADAEQVF
jgi:hypothetical protein